MYGSLSYRVGYIIGDKFINRFLFLITIFVHFNVANNFESQIDGNFTGMTFVKPASILLSSCSLQLFL
jgi:hypothetical protein